MTSSMMTGEQRWASKRRGGMTVLGKVAKVAVPKPLNLPSQRLENHGLDPSVEIVPKGTLSWGSRPSSSSSNAWATSALSPSTDGGSSSPIHLAGRPMSGGGSRPSTAGSEKGHDSNVNTWGPNSRPSSASGASGSNHSSLTSLRPHSADTRPGSSHLSRFAEHSAEGSGGLGATAVSDRMGVNEGFSLSSGDFPTLGSEKDEPKRNLEPLDDCHGRPCSSHGGVKSMSNRMEIAHDDARDSDIKAPWREDYPPFVEGGPRPNMERWHGDPHMYQNPNIGPPHYDSWRGAPSANPQGGVWYRGPPGPPPYGGPVPPGGFHMEPFPYFRPPVPAPGLSNSQSILPGAGHHGHHPKNGDMYRPHMPESFMPPGGPMRPGFYPPPGPYEGYYGPPFCNPNEQDLPFMGMAARPIYNRPTNQNAPDMNNSYPRSREGRGSDPVDPTHDPQRNYKVLVKRNDNGNQNGEEKWGHRVITDGSNRERGILSKPALLENAWGDDFKKRETLGFGHTAAKDEVPSWPGDNRFHSSKPSNSKVSGGITNVEESGAGPAKNSDSSRDHSLMQKIEGLNAKARASGGSQDVYQREELTERRQVFNVWPHQSAAEAKTETVLERHYPTGVLVPVSRGPNAIASEQSGESIISSGPRIAINEAQNRSNHHGRQNFDGQEASRWGRKYQSGSVPPAGAQGQNSAVQPTGVRMATIDVKGDEECTVSGLDSSDTQRAKMREIAKQRAIQLQKEEEERIREQKAKALAKLEELNRRSATQVAEAPSQNELVPPYSSGPLKPDSGDQPDLEANSNAEPSSGISDKIAQVKEKGGSKIVDNAATSKDEREQSKKDEEMDSVSSQNQSRTANTNFEDDVGNKTSVQLRDIPKHKRAGHKPRQNVPFDKNPSQNSINAGQTGIMGDRKRENATQENTGSGKIGGAGKELAETPLVSDTTAPLKRRNNKSGKNKKKAEDLSSEVTATPLPNNSDIGKTISASSGMDAAALRGDSTSVQLSADAKAPSQSVGNHSSLSREDDHGRVNNIWRAQHSRKARNSHGNRLSEKPQGNDAVVWAPVRSPDKVEVPDQISQKAAEPLLSSAVGENLPQSSSKTKRAEMERYVPKPVAKELAQGGSIQQPPSLSADQFPSAQASQDSSARGDGIEKASHRSDSVAKSGHAVEGKNRHVRGQGSWRQRASAESNPAQASSDSSVGSNSKNIQPNRPSELSMKGPEASLSDGWNSVSDSSTISSTAFTNVKDQFSSGRGKRQPFKGQKGRANFDSLEHKDANAGLPDPHIASEINHTEKTQSSKENRAVVDHSESHWQPKTQVYVAHNQQVKRSSGSQSHITEDREGLKSATGSTSKDPIPLSGDKAMQDLGHEESKQEKRGPRVKGRTHSHHPKQGREVEVEFPSSDTAYGHSDQRPSGYHKNSHYGSRVSRVYESRGDESSMASESKQHYSSANRGRHRQNSHYEYQAVGSYNNNNSDPQVENQYGGGPRFREMGHSRRGRGNSYARQSVNE
ncbi:hypothetical protein vseg_017060 [Gypsophila vaccaria]